MGRVIVRPIAEKLGDAIAMRYLGPGTWVRLDQLRNAVGDPIPTGLAPLPTPMRRH